MPKTTTEAIEIDLNGIDFNFAILNTDTNEIMSVNDPRLAVTVTPVDFMPPAIPKKPESILGSVSAFFRSLDIRAISRTPSPYYAQIHSSEPG